MTAPLCTTTTEIDTTGETGNRVSHFQYFQTRHISIINIFINHGTCSLTFLSIINQDDQDDNNKRHSIPRYEEN